ncbi:hypothetical protein GVN16_09860 [Emticicia sp. CRIBPO]|uniref:hypothetical protein n=1 Tax=Emticicia sp. CRIBPO TaxID=2683258 RepID=UPI001412BABB|nr:hypothetical protein [Emticicia sp. CRIBPO]NBA86067.1 hypothetical protein [Emticicia sp. CRIBPO]
MIDAQNTVLRELGLILITTQTTEKFLKVVIDFVLPKEGSFNVEDFLIRLNKGDKRTIGVFISLLQDRVDIVPWFDTLLTDFLKMRNDLIHDVDRIPGYGLTSDEELLIS